MRLSGRPPATRRACRPGPGALGGPQPADTTLANLLGIEAHQLHQGFMAKQQGGQCVHALNAEPHLHL